MVSQLIRCSDMTAQIVSALVAKNPVEPDKLPDLIREVSLSAVGEEPAKSSKPKAAVPPSQCGLHELLTRLPGKRRRNRRDAEAAPDEQTTN